MPAPRCRCTEGEVDVSGVLWSPDLVSTSYRAITSPARVAAEGQCFNNIISAILGVVATLKLINITKVNRIWCRGR